MTLSLEVAQPLAQKAKETLTALETYYGTGARMKAHHAALQACLEAVAADMGVVATEIVPDDGTPKGP